MKTLKTILAATLTAALALALPGSPSSAAGAGPDTLTITSPAPPATYEVGEQISVLLNINEDGGEVFQANLQVSPNGNDSWTDVPGQTGKTTSAYGRYTFTYTPTGDEWLRATWTQNGVPRESDHLHLTPQVPVAQTGTLNAPSTNGKTWTAHFEPGIEGKATQLQIQRIYTDEVSDVDAVNPTASKTRKMGEWKTIATSTQNANGDSTFNLSSPYPYRVAHKYRAVSGTAKTCDPPDALDTTCQTFGLPQTTPQNTGLSAVYFNSNEGHAIDTRTRYYEGEFSMTADSKEGLNCAPVDPVKFSVMKGRGNYSWSFKRKSYTLKLGSKKDLCGMGENTKYALVSQDYDKSFLRNALAGYIGKKFKKMAWTPDSTPVDFYLNGKYLGNYLLIERISIDPARVNIPELKAGANKAFSCNGTNYPKDTVSPGQRDNASHPNNLDPCKTGGYILEWDFRKGADYNANLGSDSGYVGVKDPENDLDREGEETDAGISPQQKSYISSHLNKVDTNLRGDGFTNDSTGWKKYIDEASAVDYYIAMEYMKPVDGNMWASVYMYKQRDSAAGAGDGKLYFGPMWDFDLAAGSATRAGNVASTSGFYLKNNLGISAQQSSKTWFNRLNEDPEFRSAVAARWDEVTSDPLFSPGAFLDGQKSIIQTSADRSFSLAPNGASHSYRISNYQVIKGTTWISDFNHLRSWATNRESWLSGSSGF